MPGQIHDHAAERVVVGLVGMELHAETVLEVVYRDPGIHEVTARLELLHRRVLVGVVLVADVADDLLQDVLEGDQPRRPTELVDHDGEVDPPRLHLAQERADLLGLGREEHRLANDVGDLGAGELTVSDELEEILHVEHTDHLIDRLAVDRVAAVTFGVDELHDIDEGRRRLDRDHLSTRHHHLVSDGVLELEHAPEKLGVVLTDRALLFPLLDDGFETELGDTLGVGHGRLGDRGLEPGAEP